MDTLSGGDNFVKIALSPFWKKVCSERKEFAPLGSKFFPFRVYSFPKGFGMWEGKQDFTIFSCKLLLQI